MKKNVKIALGVAAVALVGYAYWMYIDKDGDDEYFDDDYDDNDGGGLRCSEITPYACSTEGEMIFRDSNGNEVQITEECCNDLGYTFGGNGITGKNACLCDTPGEDVIDYVRPT